MKICGGLVAIKKLAFANSYRTVVGQKPQFPPLFRSGNTCANCGVSFGKCSLLFSKGGDSVHTCMPCVHVQTPGQQGEICSPMLPLTLEEQCFEGRLSTSRILVQKPGLCVDLTATHVRQTGILHPWHSIQRSSLQGLHLILSFILNG